MMDSPELDKEVEYAKYYGIISIAISSAGMTRVFEKGAIEKIKNELKKCINDFLYAGSEDAFRSKHDQFCNWIIDNVKTTSGEKVSWGQAAKVIDVTLKVCIYYCQLPSAKECIKILPWVNAAIDTARIKKLLTNENGKLEGIRLNSIKSIKSKEVYEKLQKKTREKIKAPPYNGEYLPVQYDDIEWSKGRINN